MKHHIVVAVLGTALAVAAPAQAAAPAPKTIGFTGLLTDSHGVAPSNGAYTVQLSLYTAPTDGAPVWSETKSVQAARGLFSTALGDATPLPDPLDFSEAYFVGIRMGTDAEMTPRLALQGVPYALFAHDVASNPALLARVSGGAMAAAGGDVSLLRNHAIGVAPFQSFAPTEPVASRNGLGWFDDPWNETEPTAWLSGAGGVKLFSAGAPHLALTSAGRVGIGTETPAAALDVRGDIHFGGAGEWTAPGARTPLQMVHGQVIGYNGNAVLAGYSSTRVGKGLFDVTVPDMPAGATFIGTAMAAGSWTVSVPTTTQNEDGSTRFRVETRLSALLNEPAAFGFLVIAPRE
jgi:hypothetical protein